MAAASGTVVVEIESDDCCSFEPVVGRKWNTALPKPAFVQLSDGAWQDFLNAMGGKVKSYRKEGLGLAILLPIMLLGIVLFNPAFGPLASAVDEGGEECGCASSQDEECTCGGESQFFGGMGLTMPIVFLCGIGIVFIQISFRKYNQRVDEEIKVLLSRTAVGSGANFELNTTWTQSCKHNQARTYRGVHISPAPSPAAVMVTGVPQPGVQLLQPAAQQTMVVTVPAGVKPGETVCIATPSGVQMQVVVPPGVPEGAQFQVGLAAAPVVVAAVVVPSASP